MYMEVIFTIGGVIVCLAATLVYFFAKKNISNMSTDKEDNTFLEFLVQSLTLVKESTKTFSIINNYIEKQINLKTSCVLIPTDEKFSELEIMYKDENFLDMSYFGGVLSEKIIRVKAGGILAQVVEMKNPLILSYNDIKPLFDSSLLSQCQSIIFMPLYLSDNLEAIACFIQKNKKSFSKKQISFLKKSCNYLVLTKKYIESYASFKEQERMRKELQVARQIQKKLMPLKVPNLGELHLVASNRSAKDVSGDFYDFVTVNEHKTLVIIGDASGKGVPACIISVMARSIIRALVDYYESLEDILLKLNNSLFEDLEKSRFITLAFAMIDKRQNVIECARAGHTSILLKNAKNKIIDIKPKGGAVGLLPTSKMTIFETFSMVFPKGSKMILFSDGLVEQTNKENQEFGLERLKQSWFDNDVKYEGRLTEVVDGVLKDVKDYAENTPLGDDQTLIIISRS